MKNDLTIFVYSYYSNFDPKPKLRKYLLDMGIDAKVWKHTFNKIRFKSHHDKHLFLLLGIVQEDNGNALQKHVRYLINRSCMNVKMYRYVGEI